MKNLSLVLIFFLFVVTQSKAQEMAMGNKDAGSDTQGPAITWVSQLIDLGTIPQGKPATVTFKFTNTGNQPLLLTQVKPSCGCTVANFSKAPINPGESSEIETIYNAAAKGSFSKTITVTANTTEAVTRLTIKGVVE